MHATSPRIAAVAIALAACAGAGAGRDRAQAAAAPAADPLGVARAFYAALHRGDASAAGELAASERARPALAALVTLAQAYATLEAAVGERFGSRAAREVGYTDRVAAEDAALAAARSDVSGDRAVIRAGDETLATLQRVRGAWRIVLEEPLTTEQGIAALALEAESSRDAAARVVPAIRGGLFGDPADALEAFRNDVALHMQGAEPDLPRGPGGISL